MKAERILVTGACGFIGSRLTEMLINHGLEVVAFDRYNSDNYEGWLGESECRSQIDVILGDIRDFDSVERAARGCTGIIHLAALIGIPYSYISPLAYVRTNIEGTYNVLEIARKASIDNVVVTSTSETYGSAQYVPIDEEHPLVGQSPYSATKIGADQLALSYVKSFGTPLKIARPFNTYGPRQSSRAVIPNIIRQLADPSGSLQLGNITPTRDFTFVDDTCAGILAVFASEKFIGEVANIGSGFEISIGDLAKRIAMLMKRTINIKVDQERIRPEDSEVSRLFCDNTKIRSCTNWKPKYSLDEGLKATIKWHESQGGGHTNARATYNV
jgi:dTDP-glucose 4,6-dehydratase